MSLYRIQKLLLSEYADFEDVVLIESPFAEITREGIGKRQCHIGLTSSKLILATEIIRNVHEYPIEFFPGRLDAEIECMELISIFPIELISLSVYQRRRRQILKARFHDGNPHMKPRYRFFELGGMEKKKMFWNLWCERVQFLTPGNQYASGTEASVGSSTSAGSIYLSRSRVTGNKIWCYYDRGVSATEKMVQENTSRNVPDFSNSENLEMKVIYKNKRCELSTSPCNGQFRVNRFSAGVDEKCSTGLYLPNNYAKQENGIRCKYQFKDFQQFCEACVQLWQNAACHRPARLYALNPSPDLNYCAGILGTDRAGRFSIQLKRSRSMVSVTEERLHVVETSELLTRQKTVATSQSADYLGSRVISHQLTPEDPILFFWTTDYWYKPDKINQMLAHCRARRSEDTQKTRKMIFFGKKKTKVCSNFQEKTLAKLKSAMKMNQRITAWDLDSSALASQLTIIDSALFLKIPIQELHMLKKQGNARNCKNLMTWIVFSHRVACLTATQVLLSPDTQRRARLIARFIMVCERCHRLANHQSTRSILNGLQSPAIYRLYATWARVRQYHSTAYMVYKNLCMDYSIATLPLADMTKSSYIPSVKFFLDTILGKLPPHYTKSSDLAAESSWHEVKPLKIANLDEPASSLPKIMQQILSVFNIAPCDASSLSSLVSPASQQQTDSSQTFQQDIASPSHLGLLELEGVLRASQQAARKYDLCPQRDALEYLQKMPYQEHYINFQLSLKVEPPN